MDGLTDDLLSGLTANQQAAVSFIDGPLLVLAGPGSGKTTVVSRRVAYLIRQGIPPWQILALTFTNKAAGEMRDRIEQLLPPDIPGMRGLTVATFHAFCARVLRREADAVGISDRYTIYDAAEQRDAIKTAIGRAELSDKNFTPAAVASVISDAKNKLLDAETYESEAFDFHSRAIARAYRAYSRIMRENDALDFDDLLMHVAQMLLGQDAVREAYQERFQYILIDEYQDTNHAQFTIAHQLAARDRNLCVVGDPDQSIYGWRGADLRNILDFERHYPEATTIPLGQNFRSTAAIVRCADTLIQHNQERKHKPLSTELGEGEKPQTIVCDDERHEAEIVADQFRALHREHGIEWREMAVLYRMNAFSRVVEDAFRRAQIPYVIARGTAFYDRKEIKDALAYLRLLINPSDEVALRRILNVPTRGIGRTSVDRVDGWALAHGVRFGDALGRASDVPGVSARAANAMARFVEMVESWRRAAVQAGDQLIPTHGCASLAELVGRVVNESGLEDLYRRSGSDEDLERLANLEELVSAAAEFVPEIEFDPEEPEPPERRWSVLEVLAAFLESVALVADADMVDPERGAVTLMTLHAAKGLEFDAVALIGLEHGILPHQRSAQSPRELEEERRLCFVGITRARRHLYLTRAHYRTHRGLRDRTMASQFLDELPADDLEARDLRAQDDFVEPTGRGFISTHHLAQLFPVGCRVHHSKFGIGRITEMVPRASGPTARIEFDDAGSRLLALQYANLERID